MKFNYYYGDEADQFSFIRIPKILLTGEDFAGLSLQAKVLYGLLLIGTTDMQYYSRGQVILCRG